ncbi:hypothetical protein HAX54_033631, partial [Datura stramonium]|nr:hypothetical protein [Datura stramonium]
ALIRILIHPYRAGATVFILGHKRADVAIASEAKALIGPEPREEAGHELPGEKVPRPAPFHAAEHLPSYMSRSLAPLKQGELTRPLCVPAGTPELGYTLEEASTRLLFWPSP